LLLLVWLDGWGGDGPRRLHSLGGKHLRFDRIFIDTIALALSSYRHGISRGICGVSAPKRFTHRLLFLSLGPRAPQNLASGPCNAASAWSVVILRISSNRAAFPESWVLPASFMKLSLLPPSMNLPLRAQRLRRPLHRPVAS
jgi:hypothetical protein